MPLSVMQRGVKGRPTVDGRQSSESGSSGVSGRQRWRVVMQCVGGGGDLTGMQMHKCSCSRASTSQARHARPVLEPAPIPTQRRTGPLTLDGGPLAITRRWTILHACKPATFLTADRSWGTR